MTSVYNLLREACGISQAEAAEFHEARLDSVKSWCSDRRPAPIGAINQLQSLARRIRKSGHEFGNLLNSLVDELVPSVTVYLPHDDADARAHGFPSTAAQLQAIAIAIALLPDDVEVRLQTRDAGQTIGVGVPRLPRLDEDKVIPTATDRQVLAAIPFDDRKRFYTAGNVNRRKYERLEDIGWVKGTCTNLSDVEYQLTLAGLIELALLKEVAEMAADMPGLGPGSQRQVYSLPQKRTYLKLKVGGHFRVGHHSCLVDAIDGELVTVKVDSETEVTLSAPAVLF
jgi:hypothetical protein